MGKFSDDKSIISAITASTSRNEALSMLGIRGSWWSYEQLEAARVRLNLQFAHKQPRARHRVPDSQLFVNDSKFTNGASIKKRLIEAGLLEPRCYGDGCTISEIWLCKPLSLQLDHVNGIHNDNRISNLRLLCPNCHSQTVTFSGRNSKKLETLCGCGKGITSRATECGSCAQKRRHQKTRMTHSELIDLARLSEEIGYQAAGRKFGVTGNAIKKRLAALAS